jgi:hypothetical protein
MPHEKGKTICTKFTPLFMKNGRYFKSQDEIFIRGRVVTPWVLAHTFALALHSMSMCISHSFIIMRKLHATHPCNM